MGDNDSQVYLERLIGTINQSDESMGMVVAELREMRRENREFHVQMVELQERHNADMEQHWREHNAQIEQFWVEKNTLLHSIASNMASLTEVLRDQVVHRARVEPTTSGPLCGANTSVANSPATPAESEALAGRSSPPDTSFTAPADPTFIPRRGHSSGQLLEVPKVKPSARKKKRTT